MLCINHEVPRCIISYFTVLILPCDGYDLLTTSLKKYTLVSFLKVRNHLGLDAPDNTKNNLGYSKILKIKVRMIGLACIRDMTLKEVMSLATVAKQEGVFLIGVRIQG